MRITRCSRDPPPPLFQLARSLAGDGEGPSQICFNRGAAARDDVMKVTSTGWVPSTMEKRGRPSAILAGQPFNGQGEAAPTLSRPAVLARCSKYKRVQICTTPPRRNCPNQRLEAQLFSRPCQTTSPEHTYATVPAPPGSHPAVTRLSIFPTAKPLTTRYQLCSRTAQRGALIGWGFPLLDGEIPIRNDALTPRVPI